METPILVSCPVLIAWTVPVLIQSYRVVGLCSRYVCQKHFCRRTVNLCFCTWM